MLSAMFCDENCVEIGEKQNCVLKYAEEEGKEKGMVSLFLILIPSQVPSLSHKAGSRHFYGINNRLEMEVGSKKARMTVERIRRKNTRGHNESRNALKTSQD